MSPSPRAPWLAPALVFAATFIAFAPGLGNDFVNWDDFQNFTQNPHYRGLGPAQLRWMFTTFHLAHYQPLSWVTLGLDYLVWGLNPFGYHLTNLLFHCANAALFYHICLRLLAGRALPAAFAALVFSLHPLRVESVAWATERRDVQSGFFYLASLLYYLRGAGGGAGALWRARFCYPLALLSKVTAITLAPLLLLLDIYPLKRLPADPRLWRWSVHKTVFFEKAPFLLMALVAGIIGMFAQASSPALVGLKELGLGARAGHALLGLAFYLWKTALPFGLSPWYNASSQVPPRVLAGAALIVLGALASAWRTRRRAPWILAALVFYVITLFPALGIVKSGRQFVADRFSYIPCLALAALAGALLAAMLARRTQRRFILAAAAAYLALLGFLTQRQALVWRDSESLWTRALELAPSSPLAQISLAAGLMSEGRPRQAALELDRRLPAALLESRPEILRAQARALSNHGSDLFEASRHKEAVSAFAKALQADPANADIHANMGLALYASGEVEAAVSHYRRALDLNPGLSDARNKLGIALFRQGKAAEAAAQFRIVLKSDPGHPGARGSLELLERLAKSR